MMEVVIVGEKRKKRKKIYIDFTEFSLKEKLFAEKLYLVNKLCDLSDPIEPLAVQPNENRNLKQSEFPSTISVLFIIN